MIIGIPSAGNRGLTEKVGEHFGRVPFYTILDTDTEEPRIVPNTSEHLGGRGYPAEILSAEGVDAMICKGIGRRAISMFSESGITVFTGAGETVGETMEMFKNGKLKECDESGACTRHAFRGQGKGHGDRVGHHHHQG